MYVLRACQVFYCLGCLLVVFAPLEDVMFLFNTSNDKGVISPSIYGHLPLSMTVGGSQSRHFESTMNLLIWFLWGLQIQMS